MLNVLRKYVTLAAELAAAVLLSAVVARIPFDAQPARFLGVKVLDSARLVGDVVCDWAFVRRDG